MLTLEQLTEAVDGGAVALRARTRLQPAGGAGDKVMPPTFGVEASAKTKYATEKRMVDGEEVRTVLLDSVASQANRMELGLLDGWEVGELDFPVAYVDFRDVEGLADLDRLTVLEAPHRIADAVFRDSLLDGTLFRLSDVGRAVTDATPRAATALYTYSPTALVFGMWDSTGPKGGLGSKFQRALTSEIVGFGEAPGVSVGSRIDPVGIELKVGKIYQHEDPEQEWTTDEDEAARDKSGNAILFDRKGRQGEKGRPSMINHGNVVPTIEPKAGGVTISHAEQTVVLSLAALRRWRFPVESSGRVLTGDDRRAAERSARTALAALAVCAFVYQHEMDLDLRSRCLLVPEEPPGLEIVKRDGSEPEPVSVDRTTAQGLFRSATAAASDAGIAFTDADLSMQPTPKLVDLIRRSRELARDEDIGE